MMLAAFMVANLVIALDYALLGVYFLGRLRTPQSFRRHRKVFFSSVFAALFFFGCVHTHLNLVFMGDISEQWLDPVAVASHWLQALGGFGFWYLARYHLVINIYDRKTYEQAVNPDVERRLQYLAMRTGLCRRER